MAFLKTRSDLADVLVALPFQSLMQVAHELVSMVAEADQKRDLDTPLGMAELLADWAEANQSD